MSAQISVLILTLDEEVNLPRCLASLQWCDDVVVLDSGSKDATKKIAIDWGARWVYRCFDNYSNQRNFGLKEVSYKYHWVLMVDADEEVPTDLVDEMRLAVEGCNSQTTLFRMRRKDHLFGRWIRRSSGYPTWFGRLVRLGRVRVERDINEEFLTDGRIALLQNHLHHYPFNKGFSCWIDKHNRYSTMEAELLVQNTVLKVNWSLLFDVDPSTRRKFIKAFVYRLPFRPFFMFIALYIVRGGFLDGRAGLIFCLLRSYYEFMIDCKAKEKLVRQLRLPL